jgi:hypothetical protein
MDTTLSLAHLEKVMYQFWRQSKDSDQVIPEINLSGFEGYCSHCKKPGHKADACPNRPKPMVSGGRSGNNAGRGGRGGRGAGQGGTPRFQGACRNCGKQGHMERNCWQKEENTGSRPSGYRVPTENANSAIKKKGATSYECLLCAITFPNESKLLLDPNVWIADTGASVHMTSHRQGLIDEQTATDSSNITMGNGAIKTASIIGTLPGTVCDQFGNRIMKTAITDVTSYLPTATYNFFSLTQMMTKGWVMGNDAESIWITKGHNKVTLDLKIPTPTGMIYAMYFSRDTEIAGTTQDKTNKLMAMTIQQAHERLGHGNEDAAQKTAAVLNWHLTCGTLSPCEACAAAKAKQKNVPKTSTNMAPSNTSKDARHIYLDIVTINRPDKKQVYTKNWRIMVNEQTGMKFSDFYETKDAMIEPTCDQLHRWKGNGHGVKYKQLDNAGKNLALEERSDSSDWKLGVEY